MTIRTLVLLVALVVPVAGQELDRLPSWTLAAFESPTFKNRYDLSTRLNPFYVSGDFDGDRRTDVAVLVRERSSGKEGIAVVRASTVKATVIGAGTEFGNGGDDFRWMDLWRVENRVSATTGIARKGEFLFVAKTEAASAVVYWDGRQWRWKQMGD